MRFWQSLSMVDLGELDELAQAAERFGFEGVMLSDHLLTFEQAADGAEEIDGSWGPATHWPDPWVQIGALSRITKTLKFMTGVYVLPMREPFSVAKAVSTACVLSNNRVAVGMGVGWQEPEFNVIGQNFHDRGKRADEMLVVIRKLLSGRVVSHEGDYFSFGPLCMSPGITAPLPVYVGGISPAALRRAALNQGWLGGSHSLTQLAEVVASLRSHKEKFGASLDRHFEIIANIIELDAAKCREAEAIGVTIHYRRPWVDERGRSLGLSPQEKLKDMEVFARRFIG